MQPQRYKTFRFIVERNDACPGVCTSNAANNAAGYWDSHIVSDGHRNRGNLRPGDSRGRKNNKIINRQTASHFQGNVISSNAPPATDDCLWNFHSRNYRNTTANRHVNRPMEYVPTGCLMASFGKQGKSQLAPATSNFNFNSNSDNTSFQDSHSFGANHSITSLSANVCVCVCVCVCVLAHSGELQYL